jgi:thiazole synthase ThiGH ThiG subunit
MAFSKTNGEKAMTKEVSQLARQLLGTSGAAKFYTQQEFDATLAIAKAEIMTVAIQTTKRAIMIERNECSRLLLKLAEEEDEWKVATALKTASEAILNRIPVQRQ